MNIDKGARETLAIPGVHEGMAGVAGAFVSFVPNLGGSPASARVGSLAGVPVRLSPTKDAEGPFWTSRFEVIE